MFEVAASKSFGFIILGNSNVDWETSFDFHNCTVVAGLVLEGLRLSRSSVFCFSVNLIASWMLAWPSTLFKNSLFFYLKRWPSAQPKSWRITGIRGVLQKKEMRIMWFISSLESVLAVIKWSEMFKDVSRRATQAFLAVSLPLCPAQVNVFSTFKRYHCVIHFLMPVFTCTIKKKKHFSLLVSLECYFWETK